MEGIRAKGVIEGAHENIRISCCIMQTIQTKCHHDRFPFLVRCYAEGISIEFFSVFVTEMVPNRDALVWHPSIQTGKRTDAEIRTHIVHC